MEKDVRKKYSHWQISGRLKREFLDRQEMRVSSETIYPSLYVESRGALKRELTPCLRTGRALRRPSRKVGQHTNRITGMVNIADRPPEVEDRAGPGHWEDDLIMRKGNLSAIGTPIERTTGTIRLLHLPDGYKPEQVAPVLAAKITTPPAVLRQSLTWDQGLEMQDCKALSIDIDIEIYSCDPHSPWQRGGNEHTNGLREWPVRKCQDRDSTFPYITPHGFHHTAASLEISAGANPKTVQRMPGHISAAMIFGRHAAY